eukprot:6058107-Pyramimonas_sp.AAC.1
MEFGPIGDGVEDNVASDVEIDCSDQEYGNGLSEWLDPPSGAHGEDYVPGGLELQRAAAEAT